MKGCDAMKIKIPAAMMLLSVGLCSLNAQIPIPHERRFPSGNGDVVSSYYEIPEKKGRAVLAWEEKGKPRSIIYDTGVVSENACSRAIGAAYAEADSVAIVYGKPTGSFEYLRFKRRGGPWLEAERASLGDGPMDSVGMQMSSLIAFEWKRENHPTDKWEVTSDPRWPAFNYYHVKVNGRYFIPRGMSFGEETPPPGPPVEPSDVTPPALPEGQAMATPPVPIVKQAVLIEQAKTKSEGGGWVVWLIITVIVAVSVLLLLRQTSKRNTSP